MELRINIQSGVDYSGVAAVASGLRRALNGLAGVSYTGQVISEGRGLANGWETLLVGVPASTMPAVLNMVKSHTARPGMGPMTVEIVTDGLKASFEPRALTQDQLKRLAGALSGP